MLFRVKRRLTEIVPEWPAIEVTLQAVYLGTLIGLFAATSIDP